MLAAEGSSPIVASADKLPPLKTPGETVIVEEVVAVVDCPPDGGLRAWLVVFGVRPGSRMCDCMLTSRRRRLLVAWAPTPVSLLHGG